MSSSAIPSTKWQPLYLSCIAGASTCIGAAVVFCQPTYNGKRFVPPGMMSYSLALAGSVMVTVSVVSIIPECLRDDSINDGSFHMISFFSMMMFWRALFFGLGAALYFCLSWLLNVPEPEELLHSENLNLLVGNREEIGRAHV